jgi:hypothetical protein
MLDESLVQVFGSVEKEFGKFIIVQVSARETSQSVYKLESGEVCANRVVR